jgi:hypothetical protein
MASVDKTLSELTFRAAELPLRKKYLTFMQEQEYCPGVLMSG